MKEKSTLFSAMAVSSEGEEGDRRAAAAKRWLEETVSKVPADAGEAGKGGFFHGVSMWRLQVVGAGGGRALCAFRVPRHLTDGDGNWRAGAIAALIDTVGAAAILSSVGTVDVSVDFDISYFSPAKAEEEVEIEASVLDHKGRLTYVVVAIRKKGGGALVALGKQWMSSTRPRQSKL